MNLFISSRSRTLLCGALFMASIAPAYAAGQQLGEQPGEQPVEQALPALADTVPLAPPAPETATAPAPAAAPVAPRPTTPAITRIVLTVDELPAADRPPSAYAFRPRVPPVRQLEGDVITLRAARAAMLRNDANHRQQLAALR